MTQTEKARAYDEALERARKLKENPQSVFNKYSPKEGDTICDYIFPELKESEDERIRKALIHLVNSNKELSFGIDNYDGIKWSNILTWLEKQGEQKPTLRERYKNIANSEWFKKTYEGMSISDDEKVDNVNKIEPKFKVGDWITNDACIIQITSVDDIYYWHDNDCVGGDIESVDKEYHLWTIKDAKDGDILCTPNGNTFIFKTIDGDKILDYCGLYFNKFFSDSGSPNGSSTHYDKCNYRPATKEQRDLLFKKMHEAGYEWDAEKKELKKIEYKHICELDNSYACVTFPFKAKVKSSGAIVTIHGGQLSHDGKEWIKYQSDAEDGYKVYEPNNLELVCEIEQKPDWSEEDERILDALIVSLNNERFAGRLEFLKGIRVSLIIDWLKSLKDKIKEE